MNLLSPFFLGFVVAAVGITPPGLINMTAAKVSLKDGRDEAISFAFGATLIILLQTYVALLFANFISSHPEILGLLQEAGLFIFVGLTIYFFWKAKRPKLPKSQMKVRSKTNRFFYGMLLSALNVFPVPYYVFISITLCSYGYFSFLESFIYTFVGGAVIGSFLVFYLYIIYFKKSDSKSSFLMNNGNYIIGSITALVSVLTLFRLLKAYL